MEIGKFYPLLIQDKMRKELLRIEENGNIYLRGELIGSDAELGEIFTEYGNAFRQSYLTMGQPPYRWKGE